MENALPGRGLARAGPVLGDKRAGLKGRVKSRLQCRRVSTLFSRSVHAAAAASPVALRHVLKVRWTFVAF